MKLFLFAQYLYLQGGVHVYCLVLIKINFMIKLFHKSQKQKQGNFLRVVGYCPERISLLTTE